MIFNHPFTRPFSGSAICCNVLFNPSHSAGILSNTSFTRLILLITTSSKAAVLLFSFSRSERLSGSSIFLYHSQSSSTFPHPSPTNHPPPSITSTVPLCTIGSFSWPIPSTTHPQPSYPSVFRFPLCYLPWFQSAFCYLPWFQSAFCSGPFSFCSVPFPFCSVPFPVFRFPFCYLPWFQSAFCYLPWFQSAFCSGPFSFCSVPFPYTSSHPTSSAILIPALLNTVVV